MASPFSDILCQFINFREFAFLVFEISLVVKYKDLAQSWRYDVIQFTVLGCLACSGSELTSESF